MKLKFPFLIYALVCINFIANSQHTLTADDITLNDRGFITSTSYDFSEKEIIIPATINGDTIKGINNTRRFSLGIFSRKGITKITLPKYMTIVGSRAFQGNDIDSIIFNNKSTITFIGEEAFANNNLIYLKIADFSNLSEIDESAFSSNEIETLIISSDKLTHLRFSAFSRNKIENLQLECPNLKVIEETCFFSNQLSQLDLSNCEQLAVIGRWAFRENNLSGILDFSTHPSLVQLGLNAFASNENLTSILLPTPSDPKFEGWINDSLQTVDETQPITDFSLLYTAVIPYTLRDEDLFMDGTLLRTVNYDPKYTHIILPDSANGVPIEFTIGQSPGIYSNPRRSGLFVNRNIATIKLPSTIQFLNSHTFAFNPIIDIDFSEARSLNSLSFDVFRSHIIKEIDFTGAISLSSISRGAFNGRFSNQFVLPNFEKTERRIFLHWVNKRSPQIPLESGIKVSSSGEYTAIFDFLIVNLRLNIWNATSRESIENAIVTYDQSNTVLSDEQGNVLIPDIEKGVETFYTVTKLNHDTISDIFTSDSTRSIFFRRVSLTKKASSISLRILKDSSEVIEDASVTLNGFPTLLTDISGLAFYPTVAFQDSIEVTITASEFQDTTLFIPVTEEDINEDIILREKDVINSINYNNLESDFSVFPNPVTETIVIRTENNASAYMINNLGEIVKRDIPLNKKVNMSDLEAGQYYLRVGSQYKKITKQ